MNFVIQLICAPVQPFIGHPVRAWLVSAGFALLLTVSLVRVRKLKVHPQLLLLLATVCWLLFGIYELNVPFGTMRIDILFGWPPLFILSIAAVVAGLPRSAPDQRSNPKPATPPR